ncbi:hypothetical protein CRG98_013112 [Punica granatum]|nr:hypothetical protein CRG98_013112 [Punica granatum]
MKKTVICYRGKSGTKNTVPRNKCWSENCCFRVPKRRRWEPSPVTIRFLKDLRDRAIRALCMVSLRKKASPKISSLEKSQPAPFAASADSHRSESVEACIQYINSSSSSSSSSAQSESNPNPNPNPDKAVSKSK